MLRRHVAFADDLSEVVSGRLRRIHERLELGAAEGQNADLADGSHRGRPCARLEQSDLAEVFAGVHRAHVHVAVARGLGPLDLPGLDDVEPVGRIALADDHVAAPDPHLIQGICQVAEQPLREVRERRAQAAHAARPRPGDAALELRHVETRHRAAKRPPRRHHDGTTVRCSSTPQAFLSRAAASHMLPPVQGAVLSVRVPLPPGINWPPGSRQDPSSQEGSHDGVSSSGSTCRRNRARVGGARLRRDRQCPAGPRAERPRLRPEHADERDPGEGRRDRQRSRSRTSSGRERYALLFKPGTYGTARRSRSTSRSATTRRSPASAGRPATSSSTGRSTCATSATAGGCVALNNFWRSLSNLTINVTTPDFGCYTRRVLGGLAGGADAPGPRQRATTTLMDYCTGPSFASGGFIADSRFDGSRTSSTARSSSGSPATARSTAGPTASGTRCSPASRARPRSASRPTGPCGGPTRRSRPAPVTREKPYLYVDAPGNWNVFVPAAQRNTVGARPGPTGPTPGTSIPIEQLLRRQARRTRRPTINNALAPGKNLLLTPGVYHLDQTDQGHPRRHRRARPRLRRR